MVQLFVLNHSCPLASVPPLFVVELRKEILKWGKRKNVGGEQEEYSKQKKEMKERKKEEKKEMKEEEKEMKEEGEGTPHSLSPSFLVFSNICWMWWNLSRKSVGIQRQRISDTLLDLEKSKVDIESVAIKNKALRTMTKATASAGEIRIILDCGVTRGRELTFISRFGPQGTAQNCAVTPCTTQNNKQQNNNRTTNNRTTTEQHRTTQNNTEQHRTTQNLFTFHACTLILWK